MSTRFLQKVARKLNKLRLAPIDVFVFHQVSAKYDSLRMWKCDWTQTDSFKANVESLQNEYTFISLSEAQRHLKKDFFRTRHYAVLTSDDGYASLKNILSWLQQKNIPITLFVNAKYLDGLSWSQINEQQALSSSPEIEMNKVVNGLYLTRDELWNLNSELVEVGVHGFEHFSSTDLSLDDFENNVVKGTDAVRNHPRYVPFFAYPFGRHNCQTDAVLKKHGLIPVLVTGGKNYNNSNQIDRKCIDGKL